MRTKPQRIQCEVYRELPFADVAAWTWKLAVRRRYKIYALGSYRSEAAAWRSLRKAARELGLRLPGRSTGRAAGAPRR